MKITLLESDELKLELKSLSGTPSEKENISIIFNMISPNNKYWVVSSLLSLMIFFLIIIYICLEIVISNKIKTIIISLFLFIIFLDLIPRYIVKSYQLTLISKYAKIIHILIYLVTPITFFLGKTYNYILGRETNDNFQMTKNDIKAFIELQRTKTLNEDNEIEVENNYELKFNNDNEQHSVSADLSKENNSLNNKMSLNEEEAKLMLSALDIRDKKAVDLMIPIEKTFSIDYDEKFDNEKLREITDKGYSRIPVYSYHDKNDIIGLIRIKQLLGINFSGNKSLCALNVEIRKPLVVHPSMAIIDLLKEFLKGKSHMAFITENVETIQKNFGLNRNNSLMDMNENCISFRQKKLKSQKKILGMVTLEDVMESMFGIQIYDEDDYERQRKLTMPSYKENLDKKNKEGKQMVEMENQIDRVSSENQFTSKKNQESNILVEDLPYAYSPKIKEDIII